MRLAPVIAAVAPYWRASPGATPASLAAIEQAMGLPLPPDLHDFLCWSDGGAGDVDGQSLSLWPARELVALNGAYQLQRYLGGQCLGIGSDGGPLCLLLDYRAGAAPALAYVNFGDLDPTEVRVIAPAFGEGMALLAAGLRLD
ncbi:SMI1/KNR4 family protein [Janthinobacterium sp. SUN026]|uniref:SMI1/KNR4 family protein n=1 Tax=Janthinobacterium sp. SUN026 TaxID=3002438 RepID=UPI0025B18916|nr:SMI1/KNR4 family protein [Janthinobacterium sp. SUN026]MDN2671703.1 SMI1/KNR4 family protein [Janthinobacterium sp. SUN026]